MKPDELKMPMRIEEIKRNLDPAFSYLVFEAEEGLDEKREFPNILQLFSAQKKLLLGTQMFRDQNLRRAYLVVKVKPHVPETIMEKMFERGVPKNLTCYFYASNQKA
jgi:hypothetical protein